MAISAPSLTVEVYNADYRVLSRIPWQEAVLLILRGAVYVIDVHTPAVHVRAPSLVIELPVSVALREYVHIPYRAGIRATRSGVLRPAAQVLSLASRMARIASVLIAGSAQRHRRRSGTG